MKSQTRIQFKARRFRNHQNLEDTACQKLLHDVWGLEWVYEPAYGGVPPDPYIRHWKSCVNSAGDSELDLSDRTVAIDLVNILKKRSSDSIAVIKSHITSKYLSAAQANAASTEHQCKAALEFAASLWLHAWPSLECTTVTFQEALASVLPPHTDPKTISGTLSQDFCAKHLSRKGGFGIIPTRDISHHLRSYKGSIEVFCNASMLLKLQQDPKEDPFPEDFVKETLQTLNLLFRPLHDSKRRWRLRYVEKQYVDLEFGDGDYPVFDLRQYPHWHLRLAEIQRLYGNAKPSGIAQWWFDRRDRVQWATFWVAFIVLVLTILFGLVSSVTSIVQVYAIYHPPH